MEQLIITVPYAFVEPRVQLTWQEVRFGIDEQTFSAQEAIDVAVNFLGMGHESPLVVDLASMSYQDPVSDIVDIVASLADSEPVRERVELCRVWAYLVLAWVFEHPRHGQDALDVAEKVYADLDYPEQIACFIKYMPSSDPDLGSLELNEARLFRKWETYLKAEGEYFACR